MAAALDLVKTFKTLRVASPIPRQPRVGARGDIARDDVVRGILTED